MPSRILLAITLCLAIALTVQSVEGIVVEPADIEERLLREVVEDDQDDKSFDFEKRGDEEEIHPSLRRRREAGERGHDVLMPAGFFRRLRRIITAPGRLINRAGREVGRGLRRIFHFPSCYPNCPRRRRTPFKNWG